MILSGVVIFFSNRNVVTMDAKRYDNESTIGNTFSLSITIPNKMTKPVYVFLEMNNFYQNNR